MRLLAPSSGAPPPPPLRNPAAALHTTRRGALVPSARTNPHHSPLAHARHSTFLATFFSGIPLSNVPQAVAESRAAYFDAQQRQVAANAALQDQALPQAMQQQQALEQHAAAAAAAETAATAAVASASPGTMARSASLYSALDITVHPGDSDTVRTLKQRARGLEERLWDLRVSRSTADRLHAALETVRGRGAGAAAASTSAATAAAAASRILTIGSAADVGAESSMVVDANAALAEWESAVLGPDAAAASDARAKPEELGAILDARTRRLREFAHQQARRALTAKGPLPYATTKPGLAILSLGRIHLSRRFASAKYIWPVGFASLREYLSTVTLGQRVRYICTIVAKPERKQGSPSALKKGVRDDRLDGSAAAPPTALAAAPQGHARVFTEKDTYASDAELSAASASLPTLPSAEELVAQENAEGPLIPWFVVRNDAEGVYVCEPTASASWARVAALTAALHAQVSATSAAVPANVLPPPPLRNVLSGPEMFGYGRDDIGKLLDALDGALDLANPDLVAQPYVFRILRGTEAHVIALRRERDRLEVKMDQSRDAGLLTASMERETKKRMKSLEKQREFAEKNVAKKRQQQEREMEKLETQSKQVRAQLHVQSQAQAALVLSGQAPKRKRSPSNVGTGDGSGGLGLVDGASVPKRPAYTAEYVAQKTAEREESERRRREAREMRVRTKEEGRLAREKIRLDMLAHLRVNRERRVALERACRVRWREEQGFARERLQHELNRALPGYADTERPVVVDMLLANGTAAAAPTSSPFDASLAAMRAASAGTIVETTELPLKGIEVSDALEVWSFLQAFAKDIGQAPPPSVYVAPPISSNIGIGEVAKGSERGGGGRRRATQAAVTDYAANPHLLNASIADAAEIAQQTISTIPARSLSFEEFCVSLKQGAAGGDEGEIARRLAVVHRRLVGFLLTPKISNELLGLEAKAQIPSLKQAAALLNPMSWPEVCRQLLIAALREHELEERGDVYATSNESEDAAKLRHLYGISDCFATALQLPLRKRTVEQLWTLDAAAGNPWLPAHVELELQREGGVSPPAAAAAAAAAAASASSSGQGSAAPPIPPPAPRVVAAKNEPAWRFTGSMLRCLAILRQIRLHHFAAPFLEPVDASQWKGYRKVIDSPMDLGTIERQLVSGMYGGVEIEGRESSTPEGNPDAFAADCYLVWKNCQTYSSNKSEIWHWAKTMRDEFDELFQTADNGGWMPNPRDVRDGTLIDVHLNQSLLREGEKGAAAILLPTVGKLKHGWRKSRAWLAADLWDPMNSAVNPHPRPPRSRKRKASSGGSNSEGARKAASGSSRRSSRGGTSLAERDAAAGAAAAAAVEAAAAEEAAAVVAAQEAEMEMEEEEEEAASAEIQTDDESDVENDEDAAEARAARAALPHDSLAMRYDPAITSPAFGRCIAQSSTNPTDPPPRANHPRSQRRYAPRSVFAGSALRSPVLFGYIAKADGPADSAARSVHAADMVAESQAATVHVYGAASMVGPLHTAHSKRLRAYALMLGAREYASFSVAERLGLLRLLVDLILDSSYFRTVAEAKLDRQDAVRRSLKAMLALYQERERLRTLLEKDAIAKASSTAADAALAERAAQKQRTAEIREAEAAAKMRAAAAEAKAAMTTLLATAPQVPVVVPAEAEKVETAAAAAVVAVPSAMSGVKISEAIAKEASRTASVAALAAVASVLHAPDPLPLNVPPSRDEAAAAQIALPFRAYDADEMGSVVIVALGAAATTMTRKQFSFSYTSGAARVRNGLWLSGYRALRVLACGLEGLTAAKRAPVSTLPQLERTQSPMEIEGGAGEAAASASASTSAAPAAGAAKKKGKKKKGASAASKKRTSRRPMRVSDATSSNVGIRLTFLFEVGENNNSSSRSGSPQFRASCVELELEDDTPKQKLKTAAQPQLQALRKAVVRAQRKASAFGDEATVPDSVRRGSWWRASPEDAVAALVERMRVALPQLELAALAASKGPQLFGVINMHIQTAAAKLFDEAAKGQARAAAAASADAAHSRDVHAVSKWMAGAMDDKGTGACGLCSALCSSLLLSPFFLLPPPPRTGSPHLWMPWRNGRISARAGAIASVRRHPAMIGHTLVTPPIKSASGKPAFVYKRRLHAAGNRGKHSSSSSAADKSKSSGSSPALAAAAKAPRSAEGGGDVIVAEAGDKARGVNGGGPIVMQRTPAIVSLDVLNPIFLGSSCIVTPTVALPCAFCGCPASMTLAKERSPMQMVASPLFHACGSAVADAHTTTSICATATGSVVGDEHAQLRTIALAKKSTSYGVACLANIACQVPARRQSSKVSISVALHRNSAARQSGRLVHKECSDMIR